MAKLFLRHFVHPVKKVMILTLGELKCLLLHSSCIYNLDVFMRRNNQSIGCRRKAEKLTEAPELEWRNSVILFLLIKSFLAICTKMSGYGSGNPDMLMILLKVIFNYVHYVQHQNFVAKKKQVIFYSLYMIGIKLYQVTRLTHNVYHIYKIFLKHVRLV